MNDPDGWYIDGHVSTPYGYATVYAQKDLFSIDFIRNGRHYTKRGFYNVTKVGLVRIACRFVRNVCKRI